ncbi:MAG: 4Fe-4S dicluster domain-containing protein [Anaerolineae bacterium]|nr:4Fe-4S dicluster domain-containing protein [Anaerolineae bacterium]
MQDNSRGSSFYKRVIEATPGGEALSLCLQCGTCGGSCPSGPDMDATPRRLFAMIAANMEDEVLGCNTPWYCVSCYYCTVRCPQEIPVTDLMYTLKRMAIARGRYHKDAHVTFSSNFVDLVEKNGRSFELGVMTRTMLASHPIASALKASGYGLSMMQKGRVSLTPEHIENMPQLTAILDEAKHIASQKE